MSPRQKEDQVGRVSIDTHEINHPPRDVLFSPVKLLHYVGLFPVL